MTLKEIRDIVEKISGLDISTPNREISHKVPRYIYFYLAKNYGDKKTNSLAKIGREVKRTHATVINGINKLQGELIASDEFTELYHKCLAEIPKIEVPELRTAKKDNDLRDCEIRLLSYLKDVDDSDVFDLIGTRIKPFVSMLKTRVNYDKKAYVAPAIRNHVKNYL